MKTPLYVPLMARSDGPEWRVEDAAADFPVLAKQPDRAPFGEPSREGL